MAIRRVLGLGELDLGRATAAIEVFDASVRELAADLLDTMHASPGCVGLAAPQIGVALRAFVVDVSAHKKTRTCHGEFVLFNPLVLQADAPLVQREGCMSVPDLTGDVARASQLFVEGRDLEGNIVQIETNDFEARALLHECDHLDGFVFLDRLSGPSALHARRVYKETPPSN